MNKLPSFLLKVILTYTLLSQSLYAQVQDGVIDDPGDIAFVAYHDNDDGFSFVFLDDCPNATSIRFTDEEWNGSAFSSATGEGEVLWTNNTGSVISAGTVIDIVDADDNGSGISASSGLATEVEAGFSTSVVDELFAFTGTRSNPGVFLAFVGDIIGNTLSGTGLTDGSTAHIITNEGYYSGTTSWSSSITSLASAINNDMNWTFGSYTFPSVVPDQFTGFAFQGCSMTASITSQNNISCKGNNYGSATVTQSGGTANFNYAWSNTFTSNSSSGTNTNPFLSAGTFTVTVTDDNGCTATASSTITEPSSALVASAFVSSTLACNGDNDGEVTASATGGTLHYTYAWSTGETNSTENNIGAGSYYVTVTDANGCTDSASTTLTQPTALIASASVSSNVSSIGGSDGAVVASATGGTGTYTYSWNTGETNATETGLLAGEYYVTITDANGCYDSASVQMTEPAGALNFDDNNDYVSIAHDASLNVSAVTIEAWVFWTNSGNTIDFISGKGLEQLEIHTGGSAGSNSLRFIPTTGVYLDAPAGSFTSNQWNHIACVYDPTVSEAAIYINGTSVSLTNRGANPITSAIISTTDDLNIGQRNGDIFHFSGALDEVRIWNRALCQSEIQFNRNCENPGKTDGLVAYYDFNNGSEGGNNAGLTTLSDQSSQSNDGTLVNFALNGNSSNWASATNFSSCSTFSPPTVTASITASSTISCNGGSDGALTAFASGGSSYSYLWSSGATTSSINGLSAGTYSVTLADECGGTASDQLSITEPSSLIASASVSSSLACNDDTDGEVLASATGGIGNYSYNWNTGETNATETGLGAGQYYVTITDANGCTDSASITLTEPNTLVASASVTSSLTCNGDTDGEVLATATGGTGNYTYSWNTGETNASETGLGAGSYFVTISDAGGCTDSASITLTEPTLISVSTVIDSIGSCNRYPDGGATLSASGGVSPYSFLWSNGANSNSISGISTGDYTVTVTDANSCFIVDSVFIPADTNCVTAPQNLISRFVQDTSVRLVWDTIQGATLYKVLWREASSSNWNRYVRGIPIGRLDIDSLQPGTKYFWAVRAYKNGLGWSAFSSLETFTTFNNPCLIPDGLDANAITESRVRFMWNVSANTIKYRIRYREIGGVWQYEVAQGNKDRFFVTTLSPATNYEWQIKSVCAYTHGSGTVWSSIQSFTTDPLPSPSARLKNNNEEDPYSGTLEAKIFPNPSNGNLFIESNLNNESFEVRMLDINGKLVFNKQYQSNNIVNIETNLESGIYLVKIISAKKQTVKRLVVQD